MNEDKKEYAIGIDINGKKHKFDIDSNNDIDCCRKKLISLDLSNCPNLRYLYCYSNNLTTLDLRNCQNLYYLSCWRNKLSNLDLSNCINISKLICNNNKLTSLDVSKCLNLKMLNCDNILQINEFTKYSNANIKLYI